MTSLGIYNWRESIIARREAAELANHLERYLERRLVAGDDRDFQAISSLRDIADYIVYGPHDSLGAIGSIFCVVMVIFLYRNFQQTDLYKSLKDGFVRVWTWRP